MRWCAREAPDLSSVRNDLLRRKVTDLPFPARWSGRLRLWDANRGFAHTSPHMVIPGKTIGGPTAAWTASRSALDEAVMETIRSGQP